MSRARRCVGGLVLAVAMIAGSLLCGDALPVFAEDGDAHPMPASLTYLTDGRGHYLAVETKLSGRFYYASGRGPFYQQRVKGGSFSKSERTGSWSFWSPQARLRVSRGREYSGRNGGLSRDAKGRWRVRCGARKTQLVEVKGKKLAQLRRRALLAPKHRREAFFLARDDNAVYYYVDRLHASSGGEGFRLFVGKRGAMKPYKLTTVLADEVGEVFLARGGRLVNNTVKKAASWTSGGGESTEIFPLDPVRNNSLIYNSLDVYKSGLGTPCDDL